MDTSSVPLKRCCCKEHCVHPQTSGGWLPATSDYFNRDKTSKDGFCYKCRECSRAANRQWYADNLGRALESARKWHQEHPEKRREIARNYGARNREKIRQYGREYRRVNADKIKAKVRRVYKISPEKRREYRRNYQKKHAKELAARSRERYALAPKPFNERNRRWKKKNRDKVRDHDRRRRARLLEAKGSHTAADVSTQFERQHRRCYYCDSKLKNKYHVDHVIPLARGGSDAPDNLVIACAKCNQKKNAKLLREWLDTITDIELSIRVAQRILERETSSTKPST